MERSQVPGLINDVDARTELVLVLKRVHEIQTSTIIYRELLKRFPFILQIQAVEVAVFVVIIDDAYRRGVAVGIYPKDRRDSIHGGVLLGENETATDRVLFIQFVTRIKFAAVRENISIHPRRDAGENEVAHIIGSKKDLAVTIEN